MYDILKLNSPIQILRLNNEVRGKFTSGEIVNLMSVDAERVMNWLGM